MRVRNRKTSDSFEEDQVLVLDDILRWTLTVEKKKQDVYFATNFFFLKIMRVNNASII